MSLPELWSRQETLEETANQIRLNLKDIEDLAEVGLMNEDTLAKGEKLYRQLDQIVRQQEFVNSEITLRESTNERLLK